MPEVFLEKPRLFETSPLLQPSASAIRRAIIKSALSVHDSDYQPNLAVIVRTKNDATGLANWFRHIKKARENYKGRIDTVVVDTESKDRSIEFAREFGSKVVAMSQETFNYPKSLNLGMRETRDDIEAVFATVGHAAPVTNNLLKAGARHLEIDTVVGVGSAIVPHKNASLTEKAFLFNPLFYNRYFAKGAHYPVELRMGMFATTNAMIRRSAWSEEPFDENYEAGGEDGAWAKLAYAKGDLIAYDPAVAVHHTHGLGPINFARQLLYWAKDCSRPTEFDPDAIFTRRPDLIK